MMQAEPRVRFVAAPFLPEHQPALGVSSLVAVLGEAGIAADILYLNIDYAQQIGATLNRFIGLSAPHLLLGEMIFASALWGEDAAAWDAYETRLIEGDPLARRRTLDGVAARLAEIRAARAAVPALIRTWADRILAGRPRVVGFTTTFQQNLASLALAREIRARVGPGETAILFGGANCEGGMGLALSRAFPFIDHVVSGEGERIVVDLVRHYLDGSGEPSARYLVGPQVTDMDRLPVPEFDDYFEAVAGTMLEPSANLVVESSRGCWWGMKSHCTFCGLNGQTMQFRAKDPARFADELRLLRKRYGRAVFSVADNILDMKYVTRLFPELAGNDDDVRLFYEVKANLRKDQLELLAAGGIYRLQPGIESFSTPILKLMAKGTSRLQNIQLLKWCKELHVEACWNLLFGFPGEDPAEYEAMASFLPALVHLPPPTGFGAIRLDRFSPYWRTPERYGISGVRQYWTYDFAYRGVAPDERIDLAYFFEHDRCGELDPADYAAPAVAAIERWIVAGEAKLELARTADGFEIHDSRGLGRPERAPVSALELRLLRALDSHRSRSNCIELVQRQDPEIEAAACARAFDRFVEHAWVVTEGEQLLSIVVDPAEFDRVVDRRVRLRLEHLGLGGGEDAPAAAQPWPLTA